jgi:hydroxymethylglutaryl-CoA synthase
VQKSFARLVYNDYVRNASFVSEDAAALFEPFATLSPTDSLLNRDLEKVSQQVAKKHYDVKVAPTTMLPKELGNMYCASLYAGLATLVHNKSSSLDGQRILLFSYGSGLASSLFSCKFVEGQKLAEIAEKMDIAAKLQSRIAVTPKEFVETMHLMETRYGAKDFIPVSSKSTLRPMTYYITQVDNLYRRSYDRYLTKADKVEANGVHGLAY